MRINQYISHCGFASRRAAEDLVRAGRVAVNGTVISDLGHKIGEDDIVEIDGQKIAPAKTHTTIVFHKPPGVICTAKDPQGRKTIYDCLPSGFSSLKYVGRLDYQSRGLILLSDDGDLVYKLTHPKYQIERSYFVWTSKNLSRKAMEQLLEGVDISAANEDKVETRNSKNAVLDYRVKFDNDKSTDNDTPTEEIGRVKDIYVNNGFVELVLTEGKNREIRRMLHALHYHIEDLKRVSFGNITLGDLAAGDYRELTQDELKTLKSLFNLF